MDQKRARQNDAHDRTESHKRLHLQPLPQKMILAAKSVSHFKAKFPTTKGNTTTQEFGAKETCFFYVSEKRDTAHKVFQLALKIANESVSDKNRTTAVASLMSLVHPGFKHLLLRNLESFGVTPKELLLPSGLSMLAGMSLNFEVEFDWHTILICFGCIVILLFKNINQDEYQEFMRNQIRAMIPVVGIPEQNSVDIPFNFTAASNIRARLGSLSRFKGGVIDYLLDECMNETTIASLAQYLLNVLAWSEMDSFMCIYDTLLLSKSPVLHDSHIQHEVINLYNALEEVRKAKYPQFYMYMEGLNKQSILEATKFPTLLAVAQMIKREIEKSGTLTLTYCNGKGENELVLNLYNDHVLAYPD